MVLKNLWEQLVDRVPKKTKIITEIHPRIILEQVLDFTYEMDYLEQKKTLSSWMVFTFIYHCRDFYDSTKIENREWGMGNCFEKGAWLRKLNLMHKIGNFLHYWTKVKYQSFEVDTIKNNVVSVFLLSKVHFRNALKLRLVPKIFWVVLSTLALMFRRECL